METILNSAHSILLESIRYDESLEIICVEMFRATESESFQLSENSVIQDVYAVKPDERSRRFKIEFSEILTWQVVDESATILDKNEASDSKGFVQVITNSAYEKYVKKEFGWYNDIIGETTHFRIWSENEVIDVIALNPPNIELA